jgi:hypothetical protein
MAKAIRVCLAWIIIAAVVAGSGVWNVDAGTGDQRIPIARTFLDESGRSIDEIIVPGEPPVRKARVSSIMGSNGTGANVLAHVPAFDWSYGCSATSAAMLFGYYDNVGYPAMYTGPANGGVCPMNNSAWGYGETPLSASHKGVDGRTVKGHVDDYWVKSGDKGNDPYVTGGWAEHSPLDCTADFMGTNQQKYGNADGSTAFYFSHDGAPLYDFTGSSGARDGCHGMRLYAESRGYTVETNYTQYIAEQKTGGFTFEQFQSEIDAGRPVLIQVTNHTMLGYGYDVSAHTIEVHDTWDHASHTMQWGGSYPYGDTPLQHFGVTVIHLAVPGYSLSSSVSSGSGTISRSPDQLSYPSGTVVTLTAAPSSGWHFTGWSGALTGTANPATVTMDADRTVSASFAPDAVTLALTSPNGTEDWMPGSVQSVTWTATGETASIHHFSLYYTVDGGNSWERIGYAGAADRSLSWTIPARFSSHARVILYAMDASSRMLGYDASDAVFTIAETGHGTLPVVALAHPSAESWTAGTAQEISWSVSSPLPASFHHFSVYASLEDGRNGSWFNVGYSAVPSLAWNIPGTIGSGHAKIVVYAMDASSHLLSDAVPASFAITPATGAFSMTVTAPAGGETLHVGAVVPVTWETTGTVPPQVSSYAVYYSVDGSLSWELAGTGTGSPFSWTVPLRLSSACKVLVIAKDAAGAILGAASSSAPFTIAS